MLLRRKQPRSVVPVGRHQSEVIIVTNDTTDLARKVVQARRTSGVIEVFATTESGHDTRWWILTTDPSADLDWLGVPWPHARPLSRKTPSRGSYAKTSRGTWRVGMHLIPVAHEGAERAKLISYRGIAGISIWSRVDDLVMGFALEVAAPKDGTLICQRALLNTAAQIGVRCEVASDPGFAVLTESLSRLDISHG
jgi:hypothetical protein